MQTCSALTTAALLVSVCGMAVAAPTINGSKVGDSYPTATGPGAAVYINADNPTQFGDSATIASVGNPEAVTTGVELRIPLSAIGSPTGTIRIALMINSGDRGYMSNQVLGSLASNTPNLATTSAIDFSSTTNTAVAGNQFISINPALVTTPPVIDGSFDASAYGSLLGAASPRVQKNYTGFGNATHGNITGRAGGAGADGSEIDSLYAVKDANYLYLFIGGNLEDNGNKLEIFIDSIAGAGQNQITGTATNLDGLKFDAAFSPDFLYEVNIAGTTSPTVSNMYLDYFTLPTAGGFGPTSTYIGTNTFVDAPALTGGGNPSTNPALTHQMAINNSNIAGVVGQPVGASPDRATGSEIDGVYAYVEGDTLYMIVTGNLQSSYNKLDMFFDVRPGGQNRLRAPTNAFGTYFGNANIDFSALQRMGATDENATDGLTFDDGFAADYWLSMTNGGDPVNVFTNATTLRTNGKRVDNNGGGQDFGSYEGGAKANYNPINFSGRNVVDGVGPVAYAPDANGDLLASYAPRSLTNQIPDTAFPPYNSNITTLTPGLIVTAIDNSNSAGVTATTSSAAVAGAVNTGMEIAIKLSELGWDGTSNIKICGFINGQGHDFISNQVFGGLPAGTGNLGDPRAVNFANIPGNQYIELVLSAPPAACLADINVDGVVDGSDFVAFINSFAIGDVGVDPVADVNLDGVIDGSDFVAFINAFALGC